MHSSKENLSTDDQQELSADIDSVKIGVRTNTPTSTTGNRSDVDSPVRSYALIETDPNELDRIIDVLRQFFPSTRIVECNNSSSNPSRTPSRSSLVAAPQQQASIESNSSLRVPICSTNRYRSHSHSVSEKSSFDSDILQNSVGNATETTRINLTNEQLQSNTNLQVFKGKVKDYLQRRYLEQINEHQTRKETFLKCRSADLNYRRLTKEPASDVQSFECISKSDYHYNCQSCFPSCSTSSIHHKNEPSIKARSFDSSTVLLQHSVSDTNLCLPLSSSDINFIGTQNGNIVRSQSKRRFLQRGATIDMEDAPTSNVDDEHMTSIPNSPIVGEKSDAQKITFSIDRPDDEDINNKNDNNDLNTHNKNHNINDIEDKKPFSIQPNVEQERKSRSIRHSYSDQTSTDRTTRANNHLLAPTRHSVDHQHQKLILPSTMTPISFPNGLAIPVPPYSAASDPGAYNSPWARTPANPYGLINFHFPKSQENLAVHAQGSISQLSSLTKVLCDEPTVFTPISPRFKAESQEPNSTINATSVPPCQICGRQFETRQLYLIHYRTHLERSCDDTSGTHDYTQIDNQPDRPGESRNYSCKICSKRFSRSDMLNRHLRLHSGIRPYRCTMCNTHFSRSDHLSTHLRTHTGEKPYTCPECSYAACRRDMITRHLKVHSKQRSERKNATSSLGSSNES